MVNFRKRALFYGQLHYLNQKKKYTISLKGTTEVISDVLSELLTRCPESNPSRNAHLTFAGTKRYHKNTTHSLFTYDFSSRPFYKYTIYCHYCPFYKKKKKSIEISTLKQQRSKKDFDSILVGYILHVMKSRRTVK